MDVAEMEEMTDAVVDAKVAEAQCEAALRTAQAQVQSAEVALKAARQATSLAWENHNRSIAQRVRRTLEAG